MASTLLVRRHISTCSCRTSTDAPTRLPGHDSQRQGPPALRQLLHQRRHRLHFWPLRSVVVRGLRHRVDRTRVHHSQRTRVGQQLCLLRLQQGHGHGNSRQGLDISGPPVAPVRSRRLSEQQPERCCQSRRLDRLGRRQCHRPRLLQGVPKHWRWCRPLPACSLQWCLGGGYQDHRHTWRVFRAGDLG